MTDLKLRDAFDSDSVPLKNIALKKAYIRMDELEGALERANATTEEYERKYYLGTDRIEALEAALREIVQEDALTGKTVFVGDFGKIARKALDAK